MSEPIDATQPGETPAPSGETSAAATAGGPDTVVLIHGLWMTARSWEHWIPYYEAKGYRVLAPAYPGLEVEVEALRANPQVIADLTVPQVLEHLAELITGLDKPPILMGHSFGGTFVQLLLARGLGAAGAVFDSAPPEGVRVSPPSQARSLFPILRNPRNRNRATGFTKKEFRYAFTNMLSQEDSDAAYTRYYIPAPGRWVFDYGLLANYRPGHQETYVDFSADRAPLLLIAGGADHIMPAAVNRSNCRKYSESPAITDYHEFPGRSHFTCGEPGWERVADLALEWTARHARTQ